MKIKAFTLVEVLVVIVIIGVIMLITRPIAISIFENAKEKTFSVMVEKIADAGENYITDYEVEYGRTLSNIVIEITDTQQNDNILRLSDDPDVNDAIKFLREREIVHYQRFGESLRKIIDKLDSKNFYAINPAFDK